MPRTRSQRRFVRGVVFTLVFVSFSVSTFFFVRDLYRRHKSDLRARHARLHTGMTEADICKEFGQPAVACDADFVHEFELGRPPPACGLEIKSWCLGRQELFSVYVARDGEVLKVNSPHSCDQRTWIERRIDEWQK